MFLAEPTSESWPDHGIDGPGFRLPTLALFTRVGGPFVYTSLQMSRATMFRAAPTSGTGQPWDTPAGDLGSPPCAFYKREEAVSRVLTQISEFSPALWVEIHLAPVLPGAGVRVFGAQ